MTTSPPPSGGYGAEPSTPPPVTPQLSGLSAIFDFSFTRFATPSVIRILYVLGFVGIVLTYLAYLVIGFTFDPVIGLVTLLFGWIVALLFIILWRVTLEFYLAVIRMSEDIHHRLR